jgi:hypothetical protein
MRLGKDATDAFEDVGHSDEAREILAGLLKGELDRRVCLFFLLSLISSLEIPFPMSKRLSAKPRQPFNSKAPVLRMLPSGFIFSLAASRLSLSLP